MWKKGSGSERIRRKLALLATITVILLIGGLVSPVPVNLQGKWRCAGPGYNMTLELTRNAVFLRDASGRPMLLQANGEVKTNIFQHAAYLLRGASSQYVFEAANNVGASIRVQKVGNELRLFEGLSNFSRCGSTSF